MTFAEEKRTRRAAKHEIFGGLIQDRLREAHPWAQGQIEWTQFAQYAKDHHEDFWRGVDHAEEGK